MTLQRPRALLLPLLIFLLACGALVVWMFYARPPEGGKDAAKAAVEKERTRKPVSEQPLTPAAAQRRLEDAPPVNLDFHDAPLTAIIDELVRQSGIKVVADFSAEQDAKRVTLQMNAPPFHVLQTITKDYQMELLQTDSGWWLRPFDALQSVCYEIHSAGLEAGTQRVDNLVQAISKLAGTQPDISVTADAGGIHVKAPPDIQALAEQYLESAFHRKVPAKREDLPPAP